MQLHLRVALAVAALVAASCSSAGFDSAPYQDAITERFDDGDIMNTEQARCVADGITESVDWEAKDKAGLQPTALFDVALTEQFDAGEVDALINAIDDCRGAADVVLRIFESDGQMAELQLGCFASQMTTQSARDLLRLIIADDQGTFVGTEGEILLGVCGQGVAG